MFVIVFTTTSSNKYCVHKKSDRDREREYSNLYFFPFFISSKHDEPTQPPYPLLVSQQQYQYDKKLN